MEKGALTFPGGPTFPRERESNCIFLYKPIEFVLFQGIVLVKRLSMTLTPLMQVLCGCGKQRQGPTV